MTEVAADRGSAVADQQLAISVRDLDVEYRVYEDTLDTTKNLFVRGIRSRRSTRIHALKSVSLDIGVGEAVGIIGSNGSGKSTFLRAIAGLQSKTGGQVLVRGNARLLGVGAALKPRLSGYRNVVLGGLAMGLKRDEVEARLDEVAEYSGLGEAMARPMITYSSGMRARLAFSIATLTIPDILLIDEALAVGDLDFKTKSLEKVAEIRANAGTVVMVSHSLIEIRNSCPRAIWLEGGKVIADGDVDDVVTAYENR